jgi:hypothetical protein
VSLAANEIASTVTLLPRAGQPVSELFLKASDTISAFTAASQGAANGAGQPGPGVTQRDWPAALALIEETSEAIRLSDLRYAQLDDRLQQTIAQAAVNMRELENQLATANDMLRRAEERARHAEIRALEAEAWLARLHDAVTGAFAKPVPPARG